jgi:AraC-like DNA-binding protein
MVFRKNRQAVWLVMAIGTAPLANAELFDYMATTDPVKDQPSEQGWIADHSQSGSGALSTVDGVTAWVAQGEGAILNNLLHRNGQIQQMFKAVDYIYNHMDQTISVDELACSVQMGSSRFHRKFKEVMHLSPVQYIKKIKLVTAQAFILEGKSVSEAGYQVGYKSPSQFSREYKRFFGKVPSDV